MKETCDPRHLEIDERKEIGLNVAAVGAVIARYFKSPEEFDIRLLGKVLGIKLSPERIQYCTGGDLSIIQSHPELIDDNRGSRENTLFRSSLNVRPITVDRDKFLELIAEDEMPLEVCGMLGVKYFELSDMKVICAKNPRKCASQYLDYLLSNNWITVSTRQAVESYQVESNEKGSKGILDRMRAAFGSFAKRNL